MRRIMIRGRGRGGNEHARRGKGETFSPHAVVLNSDLFPLPPNLWKLAHGEAGPRRSPAAAHHHPTALVLLHYGRSNNDTKMVDTRVSALRSVAASWFPMTRRIHGAPDRAG